MRYLLYCFKISWKSSRFYTISRVICKISVPILSFFDAYVVKLLLDMLAAQESKSQPIILFAFIVILSLVIKILSSSMNGAYIYSADMQSKSLNHILQKRVMKKGIDSDVSLFDDTKKFNHFSTVQRDIQAFINYFWYSMEAISSLVFCAISFLVLAKENILYGIVIVMSTVPSVFIQKYFTKKYYKLSCELIQDVREADYTFQIATTRNFCQIIRTLNIGKWIEEKFDALWKHTFQEQRMCYKELCRMQQITQLIPQVMIAGIEFIIVLEVLNGKLSIGSLTLYTTMLSQLVTNTNSLVASLVSVYDNRIKIENIKAYDEIKPSVEDNGKEELAIIHSIRFENVSFTYPNSKKMILSNVSFDIGSNEFVALVGENGSGKTTIVKLLLRLYDVTDGRILINHRDIKDYTLESLRRQCCTYFQNQENFSYSIRENIQFGDMADNDVDHVMEALKKSDSMDIINKAPRGIYTCVSKDFSEEGLVLSGGENQKLALAQTIYGFNRASLIILDEPSSALDALSEQRILDNINDLRNNKEGITFLISHQLSNIQQASKIFVLSDGKIIEHGKHDELMQIGGLYAFMYTKQANRYESKRG